MTEPSAAVLDFLKAFKDSTTLDVLPVSARIAAEAQRKEAEARRKEEEHQEAIRNAKPGDLIDGEGIFLCRYEPMNSAGSLGKIFNVFAAPEDLKVAGWSTFTYLKAVEALAKDAGTKGKGYANADELFAALANGSYNGEWVLPPLELVGGQAEVPFTGSSYKTDCAVPDNLFRNRNWKAFKGNLTSGLYWSCSTESDGVHIGIVDFQNGCTNNIIRDSALRARPVRLVEVKP